MLGSLDPSRLGYGVAIAGSERSESGANCDAGDGFDYCFDGGEGP